MNLNNKFEQDPGSQRGRWLCEEEAVQIKVSNKATAEDAYRDIVERNAEILVYSNSNMCWNDKQQLGGRFTFTIPRSLFLKVLPVREAAVKIDVGDKYTHVSAQRAPGKRVSLSLSPELTAEQKLAAIQDLEKNPILLKLFYRDSAELNRMTFMVLATKDWIVS